MKKLVLLFAAVFALTFVSCDNKDAQSSASSASESVESVSGEASASATGEVQEVKEDATQSDAATTDNQEAAKSEG